MKYDSLATHSLVIASNHDSHGEAHALVVVGNVGEELGGRGHGDALAVPQLVQAALLRQHPFPVGAIGSSTCHGSEQKSKNETCEKCQAGKNGKWSRAEI